MFTARQIGTLLPISLFLAMGAYAPVHAAAVQRAGDKVIVLDDDEQPISGVTVDIVSTDGSFTTEGFTHTDGSLCVLGRDNSAVAQGRPECLYLPDGQYQLFVTDQPPVRFAVRNGVIDIAAASGTQSSAKTGWIVGGAVLLGAGLAGGGGGGGSSDDDDPMEPQGDVAVSVDPQMLSGEFEFGVSPCPTTIGDLTVTNTGDVDARITVVPIDGISTTGQGQLIGAGESGTVTVLFNCLVISAIAGNIEVGLTNDGQADSNTIEIVVDFR